MKRTMLAPSLRCGTILFEFNQPQGRVPFYIGNPNYDSNNLHNQEPPVMYYNYLSLLQSPIRNNEEGQYHLENQGNLILKEWLQK
jgi:hypothetical protein